MAGWKRAPRSVFQALFAVAVGLTILASSSQAGDGLVQRADFGTSPDPTDSAVRPVVYTTGERGGKLAWLPYRPHQAPRRLPSSEPNASPTSPPPVQLAPPQAPPAQLISNAAGEAPVRSAILTPMTDPFSDRQSVAQRSLAAEPLSDRVLEGSTAEEDPPSAIDPPRLGDDLPDDMEEPIGIEQRLAQNRRPPTVECQPASEILKPIHEITHDISAPEGLLPVECPLQYELPEREDWYLRRSWARTTFHWKASGLCHKPSYFEDVQLERYGHSWGPYVQPLASGAHFFLTVPVLPYKMGLYPPNECIYTLGYYRAGSCAPYLLDPIPLSARAALAQAGAVVGAVAILP